MIGTYVDNFKIVGILGEGGMGVVYKAYDTKLERFVALKILNTQATLNPKFVERFKREAKNQAKLNHPNIVAVYGFIQKDNLIGIAMEYIQGETLDHRIQKLGRLSIPDAISTLKQVVYGICYAHKKGFIHRDLKPSNIIIDSNGVTKIMDFGISKSISETKSLTNFGANIGTVLYMSPEQIKSNTAKIQSDIYSIGITFYEMISGHPPFDYRTEYEVMDAHIKYAIPKLSAGNGNTLSAVDQIIKKATYKDYEKRYASGEELLKDLNQIDNKNPKVRNIKKRKVTSLINKKNIGNILKLTAGILLFLVLLVFVIFKISEFWKKPSKDTVNLETYSGNPAYIKHSEWMKVKAFTNSRLNSIGFVNDSVGIVCGSGGTIFRTSNTGKNWEPVNINSSSELHDVLFINTSHVLLFGDSGKIFISEDKGKSWTNSESGTKNTLFGSYFLRESGICFAVGDEGIIIKSSDFGRTWSEVNTPGSNLLYGISFVNDKIGFAVGWEGELLKTVDSGNNWIKEKSFTNNYLRDISFRKDGIGIITAGGGSIFRTDNLGKDWEEISVRVISGLTKILFLDPGTGLILSSNGDILITRDSGKNWQKESTGNFAALLGIAKTPSNRIFICGENGTLFYRQFQIR